MDWGNVTAMFMSRLLNSSEDSGTLGFVPEPCASLGASDTVRRTSCWKLLPSCVYLATNFLPAGRALEFECRRYFSFNSNVATPDDGVTVCAPTWVPSVVASVSVIGCQPAFSSSILSVWSTSFSLERTKSFSVYMMSYLSKVHSAGYG